MHKMVEEDENLLRKEIDHNRQVENIENAVGQEKEKLMTEYGINRRNILNELLGFHVTEGAPPDLIHDLILGGLPKAIQYLCQKVILNKISVADLNKRIASFDFDYTEVDKRPPPLKVTHLIPGSGIKLSAVEIWTLAYILPFVIQDLVEINCSYFENYLTLLQISCIVFGFEIGRGMIDTLGHLITEYLQGFTDLYGVDNLIPKQHFMIHYSKIILYFGPLYVRKQTIKFLKELRKE